MSHGGLAATVENSCFKTRNGLEMSAKQASNGLSEAPLPQGFEGKSEMPSARR